MRRLALLTAVLALLLPPLPAAASSSYQVINGTPAAEGAYPAMAAVLDRDFGQFCGGTLIDAHWVVTAAHCFYDARTGGSGVAPSSLEIAVDTTDWRQGGERLAVDRIVLHPDYDDLRTVNDIAMLRLASPAATAPAVLDAAEALHAPGRTAWVTGWGATDPYGEQPSAALLETTVPLVSDGDCARSYDIIADRHICAGAPGTEDDPGNDTCQGDSGGPMWTDRDDGTLALIGITSFGNLCGVEDPGVYTEARTYLGWIGGLVDGSIDPGAPEDPTTPGLPDDAAAPPVRVVADGTDGTDPVAQAIAISQVTFGDGLSEYGVVATSTAYADALGGSALGYGVAPVLFVGPDGTLSDATLAELRRTVRTGGRIYVLGGVAAVPAGVDSQLQQAGFAVQRLAGEAREETAAVIADEVVSRFGELPRDTVIVATRDNWPDAVVVGQVAAWWGVPILLTQPGSLHPTTADALARLRPSTVLVAGGTTVVSDSVVGQIEDIAGPGSTIRLGGDGRFDTAAAVTGYDLDLFGTFAPGYIIAVNLRHEPEGYAHVLAASMLAGGFAGVFAPVEGDTGDMVPDAISETICGLDVPIIVAGGPSLISDASVQVLQDAAAGVGCDATGSIATGEIVTASLTSSLPVRSYSFTGQVNQTVRIRLDAAADERRLDPVLTLYGPDGDQIAVNDDSPEGGLNSLIDVTLPADGIYRIEAAGFQGSTGRFLLSLDPGPLVQHDGDLGTGEEVVVTADVPVGTTFVVEMRAVPGNQTDPVLIAYDQDGGEIGFDDDGAGFPNARMVLEAPGGPVQVVGSGFDGSGGPYSLTISELAGPGDPDRYAVG